MTFLKRLKALCLASVVAATPFTSWADAGHDHGAPAPAALGSGLPRFSAVSETFELVGVLNGKQLTLYLDRTADNSPVKDAQLDLELGGVKLDLKPLGEGEFGATLAQEPKVGVTSVAATVAAGQETDLLAGDLEIRDNAPAVDAATKWPWKRYGAWLLAGLLTLALLVGGLRRARTHQINRLGTTK
jgi:hypothetical protein